jgi:hypothetical protein
MLTAAGAPRVGRKWVCPAHGLEAGHSAALSVTELEDGRARLHCFAGCTRQAILKALCLVQQDLKRTPRTPPERHAARALRGVKWPAPAQGHQGSPASRGFRFEGHHYFGTHFRKERLRHPTTGDKEIRWEAMNHKGEWVPGLLGRSESELPLYREADLTPGMAAGEPVLLVESESSVDALRGWYATTWAGGAGSPALKTLQRVLGGYEHLLVIPDHDTAGLQCLEILRRHGLAPHVLVPDREGEDPRDLLERLGPRAFAERITAALRDGTGDDADDVDADDDAELDEPLDDEVKPGRQITRLP